MLIRTKLLGFGCGLSVLLIMVGVFSKFSFDGLTSSFLTMVESAELSAENAKKAAQGSSYSSEQLVKVNQDMLGIVSEIKATNQRTRLVIKKVGDISDSLSELRETIEELSEDVTDEESLAILEEVSDEVADIEERLQREALVNINQSAEKVDEFSRQIEADALLIDKLNEFSKGQVVVSQSSLESSGLIKELAQKSSGEVAQRGSLIVIVLLSVAALTLIAVALMVKWIVRPINITVKMMESVAQGRGDLTQRLAVRGNDEMAMIASGFNRFIERIQTLVMDVNTSTTHLQGLSSETLQAMREGNQNMDNQQQEIEQIATAMQEMSMSSKEVAQNTHATEVVSVEMNQYANSGQKVVGNAVSSVEVLVNEVERAVGVIQALNEKSTSIYAVVNVIKGVSEQTNLLALNAAIEAARAGKQGRGFAVVADEVRALAATAENSTADIRQIVDDIQELTSDAVKIMESSKTVSVEALESVNGASHELDSIKGSILSVTEMTTQITVAADEQSSVVEDVNKRIQEVNNLAGGTLDQVSKTVENCQSLNDVTSQLSEQLTKFKV